MLPGCLHTALLPWRQARYHHAGLTNGVLVLDPWIVSEVSAASPGVEGPARCSLPSEIPHWFELASEPSGRAGGRSVSFPSPGPRVLEAGAGWPRCCERSEVIEPQSGQGAVHTAGSCMGLALLCTGSMTSERSSPRSRAQFPHV